LGQAFTGVEYGFEMSRAIPWSIKGVDLYAREAASDAALREGMTLGQWLKQTIEIHAAERGLDAFCLDDDERAAAVKERLARMAGHESTRRSSVEPSRAQASPSVAPQSPNQVNEMLRNLSMRLGENPKVLQPHRRIGGRKIFAFVIATDKTARSSSRAAARTT
jgi:hypothetical protein